MNVKPAEKRMVNYTCRLPIKMREALEKEAERRNVNTVDLVREALLMQAYMKGVQA